MPNTEPSMIAQPPSARAIPPGTYVADSARSQLSFRAKAFGLIWVHGHMPAVGGTIHVSEGRLRGHRRGRGQQDQHRTAGPGLAPAHETLPAHRAASEHPAVGRQRRHRLRTRRLPCHRQGKPASIGLELDSAQVSDGTLRLRAHGTIDRSSFGMLPPPYGVSRLVHVVLTVVAMPAATHR